MPVFTVPESSGSLQETWGPAAWTASARARAAHGGVGLARQDQYLAGVERTAKSALVRKAATLSRRKLAVSVADRAYTLQHPVRGTLRTAGRRLKRLFVQESRRRTQS